LHSASPSSLLSIGVLLNREIKARKKQRIIRRNKLAIETLLDSALAFRESRPPSEIRQSFPYPAKTALGTD
jgi:hypothetical protein